MPVHQTTKNGKPAMQWGSKGAKYTYTAGNKASRDRARSKAERQGRAARAGGVWRMNCREIIEQYLRDNGYDGLSGNECGCLVGDISICDCLHLEDCVPGHRVMCGDCERADECVDNITKGEEFGMGGQYCVLPGKKGGT